MSIVVKNHLDIDGYKVKLSDKLRFYKGDILNLSFSISNKLISNIASQNVVDGILPVDNENIKAYMIVENIEIVGTIIKDNNIIFKLEPKYQTVGISRLQIIITETLEDGTREILHTPPFNIEIALPLSEKKDLVAYADYAVVGVNVVGEEVDAHISIDENYQITIWETGDIITAEKLNKIENQLLIHANKLAELLYVPISIASISLSKTIAEMGEVVTNLIVDWKLNKTPTSQSLNDTPIDNETKVYIYPSQITTNSTFTLKVSDGKTNTSKSTSINFYNAKYYGVSNLTNYDSSFILSLSKQLTNSRQGSFTVDCGQGEYIYFCIPTRFENPTFSVNGFKGGFIKCQSLSFTNKFGYVETYDIWKSENSNLGKITVVVE